MKAFIIPPTVDGPFGGGNQFAKALKNQFSLTSRYAASLSDADTVILNGYPFRDVSEFKKVVEWKQNDPENRRIISRIDGPIAAIRNNSESCVYDDAVYAFAKNFSDGMIVQSEWTLRQMKSHQLFPEIPYVIIGNAPNPNIFYPAEKLNSENPKIRIIASSWSTNPQKGFPVYQWLDSKLDFDKIEFIAVGAKGHNFENIEVYDALPQPELADLLRQSDIYLTASRIESCSNAALEALHCGLPVIAPNDSSYPEYMPNKGLLYDNQEEIPNLIDDAAVNLKSLRLQIQLVPLEEIAENYINFAQQLSSTTSANLNMSTFEKFEKLHLPHQPLSVTIKRKIKQWLLDIFQKI